MYTFDQRRLDKLASLREAGVEPFPAAEPVTDAIARCLEAGGDRSEGELEALDLEFVLAGRLMAKNEMGRAGFAMIEDRSGRIQIYVRKNDVGPERFQLWKALDLGDVVRVRGSLMVTRRGDLTLRVAHLALAAKCMKSLPDKWKGLKDIEFRHRHRYVDLLMNADVRRVFQVRSQVVQHLRRFFEDRGFMEVETPMMQVIPGGATARPFVTHHNALDLPLYLRVAPELYLKRLLVGGFERVYELNRCFRNEGISPRHNPEFTMLEFYQAHATYRDLMDLTETLISGLVQELHGGTTLPRSEHDDVDCSLPWRRVSMGELVSGATGLDASHVMDPEALRTRWLQAEPDADPDLLPTTYARWWELIFDEWVESELVAPTFVTRFPVEISPLARRCDDDPRFTDRFELYLGGEEIANAFTELNDPVDQAQRFAEQARLRQSGEDEAMFFDADYVEALSYGMPPAAGEGIGIDRLVMALTDNRSIREVILFPTLRPRQGPDRRERSSGGA